MKKNYQKELEDKIRGFEKEGLVPTLFLHSCCAPCSSYVLEYLSRYFSITVFYYNPNITDREEYQHRVKEQQRLIAELPAEHAISFVEGAYDANLFFQEVKGLEKEPEGGARCRKCFELRLAEAAKLAAQGGFDYFTTTLTISPLKNAEVLNQVGDEMAERFPGSSYLHSDFKKKNGYKRSTELSAEYGLYRQDYCGCIFSKLEREAQKESMQ